jgi:hypothetical protein
VVSTTPEARARGGPGVSGPDVHPSDGLGFEPVPTRIFAEYGSAAPGTILYAGRPFLRDGRERG